MEGWSDQSVITGMRQDGWTRFAFFLQTEWCAELLCEVVRIREYKKGVCGATRGRTGEPSILTWRVFARSSTLFVNPSGAEGPSWNVPDNFNYLWKFTRTVCPRRTDIHFSGTPLSNHKSCNIFQIKTQTSLCAFFPDEFYQKKETSKTVALFLAFCMVCVFGYMRNKRFSIVW